PRGLRPDVQGRPGDGDAGLLSRAPSPAPRPQPGAHAHPRPRAPAGGERRHGDPGRHPRDLPMAARAPRARDLARGRRPLPPPRRGPPREGGLRAGHPPRWAARLPEGPVAASVSGSRPMPTAEPGPGVVRVEGLRKEFEDPGRGQVVAVDGIDFACRPGEIFGLLGANGAGKTTTLRVLATILRPTAGRASVNGHDVLAAPDEVRRSLGFHSASTALHPRLTARETPG